VGAVGIIVAAFLGALAGLTVGPAADAIATPRYGPDSEGHDPEDQELALAAAPTSARARNAAVVVTTLAVALLAGEFGDVDVWLFFVVLTYAYVVAALIDLQYLRLPDVLTWPAAGLALAGSFALSARHLDDTGAAVAGAAGALAVAGFVWAFSTLFRVLRGREAFGLGDVKLMLSLGFSVGWLGWAPLHETSGPIIMVVYAVMAGFLIGALAGLPAAGFRMSKHIPFGPFLMVGWFVVVLFADSLRA
jgi:prepilin signal peptidase PulO-like enzyme (type II secretory pathway)